MKADPNDGGFGEAAYAGDPLRTLRCLDCKKPYAEFPLDVVLPRGQWLEIHPGDGGVLCAGCIVVRAAKVQGATVCHLVIEVTPAAAYGEARARENPRYSADAERLVLNAYGRRCYDAGRESAQREAREAALPPQQRGESPREKHNTLNNVQKDRSDQ